MMVYQPLRVVHRLFEAQEIDYGVSIYVLVLLLILDIVTILIGSKVLSEKSIAQKMWPLATDKKNWNPII